MLSFLKMFSLAWFIGPAHRADAATQRSHRTRKSTQDIRELPLHLQRDLGMYDIDDTRGHLR